MKGHMPLNDKVADFMVTGSFVRSEDLTPQYDAQGKISGYKTLMGTTIRLVVALEIESKGGDLFAYVTSEDEMDRQGLSCLDYDHTSFTEREMPE